MDDYCNTFRPFSQRSEFTTEVLDDEEEDYSASSSSSDEDEDIDDLSTDVTMTTKEANSIVEMARQILDTNQYKIDNPRILRACQIYNAKRVSINHFELQMGTFRKFCFRFGQSSVFNNFILAVVIANVLMIILQTDPDLNNQCQYYISGFDQCCLALYIFEAIVKIIGQRETYFYDAWNDLDFVIVLLSFIDYITASMSDSLSFNPAAIRAFRVFRTLRALRAIKMLKNFLMFQSLLTLLDSVASSFVECVSSMALLLIIMYFYAFIGLTLYKEVSPDQFGDFAKAFFSMFQLCTLDDWFDVYDSVKVIPEGNIFFFITFILIGSFIIMNYITAVLTDNACSAAVKFSENSSWIRKLIARHRSLKENEELMKSKHSHTAGKQTTQLSDKYPEMSKTRLNDISQVLAILGEIERTQLVADGHKAVYGELIDQALKEDH